MYNIQFRHHRNIFPLNYYNYDHDSIESQADKTKLITKQCSEKFIVVPNLRTELMMHRNHSHDLTSLLEMDYVVIGNNIIKISEDFIRIRNTTTLNMLFT